MKDGPCAGFPLCFTARPMPRIRFDLTSLNPPQLQAVRQLDGPVLILAGAGTGKTRVVTTRIAYMIEDGVAASGVLAVTFTNKAANEMRERVERMIRKRDAEDVTICTFHSLCVRILRTSIERLGYKQNFTIYSGSDQTGLVRKIIARKAARDEKLDPGFALSMISKTKNTGIPCWHSEDSLIAEVYRTYNDDLKQLNAVDFDDLLVLAVRSLEEHKDLREQWQRRFTHIMVDEFQDTNSLQMRLMRSLVGPARNVCVVGDDDQSIYGWRGAEVSNILDFEQFFAGPVVVKLEENYRSTTPILETANSLIKHNQNRREKRLWTQTASRETIRIVAMPGEQEEAELVVGEILAQNADDQRDWNDFAILFRMNAQSRIYEQELRKNKIPYRLIGGQSFFDRREVKDLLAYLHVIVNPDDDINLLRIINNPPRGIGANTIKLATEESIRRVESIHETLSDQRFTESLSRRAGEAVGEFLAFLDEMRDDMLGTAANYPEAFIQMIKRLDFVSHARKSCKTEEEGARREENIRDLVESVEFHYTNRKRKGLQRFLNSVALMQDREDKNNDDLEKQKGVTLITMHAAKGLEFPVVYIVGVEEGILPHTRSVDEGSRDEERRLLYVGITRAKEKLAMTYCATRKKWGDLVPCEPSSFLADLSDKWLETVDFQALMNEPVEEAEAAAFFAQMRARLEG